MRAATTSTTPTTGDPLLRTTEVAALLGMSREQVWRLWSAGRLPGYKLDRHLRFAPRDIHAFLQQHYTGAHKASTREEDAPRPRGRTAHSTGYQRI